TANGRVGFARKQFTQLWSRICFTCFREAYNGGLADSRDVVRKSVTQQRDHDRCAWPSNGLGWRRCAEWVVGPPLSAPRGLLPVESRGQAQGGLASGGGLECGARDVVKGG